MYFFLDVSIGDSDIGEERGREKQQEQQHEWQKEDPRRPKTSLPAL
jgi:hypothetical protein